MKGICRKVKLHYFLVGHGHCDGDREIGLGGCKLSNERLQTFEEFRTRLKKCFANQKQYYAEVERCFVLSSFSFRIEIMTLWFRFYVIRIVGITDYDAMFAETVAGMSSIHGLTKAQVFSIRPRPKAKSTENGVDVHYMTRSMQHSNCTRS